MISKSHGKRRMLTIFAKVQTIPAKSGSFCLEKCPEALHS